MSSTTPRHRGNFVVVEDDPTFLSFWRRIFDDIGTGDECHFMSDPMEAKRFLEGHKCDMLISDIIMPVINGYELARIARGQSPSCEIVLTTAYGAELSRFDLAGYRFHLLHKPYINVTDIKLFVKHLIEGDRSFDDLPDESSTDNEDYPDVTEWKL